MYRKDRACNDKEKGGGVLLYVRNSLNTLETCDNKYTESIWINLYLNEKSSITVGVCYRTPSITNENEKILFDKIKEMAKKPCVIMGDFNFPDINWSHLESSSKGEEFLVLILDSFLLQNVTKPTRGKNILDLVLSSDKEMVNDLEIQCPVANSDHNVICWQMRYMKDACYVVINN